jgi:hypothetical protein
MRVLIGVASPACAKSDVALKHSRFWAYTPV